METSFSIKAAGLHLGYLGDHLEQGLRAPRWLRSQEKHLHLPLPPVYWQLFQGFAKDQQLPWGTTWSHSSHFPKKGEC